jgi:hypothetical protein
VQVAERDVGEALRLGQRVARDGQRRLGADHAAQPGEAEVGDEHRRCRVRVGSRRAHRLGHAREVIVIGDAVDRQVADAHRPRRAVQRVDAVAEALQHREDVFR